MDNYDEKDYRQMISEIISSIDDRDRLEYIYVFIKGKIGAMYKDNEVQKTITDNII